MVDQLTVTETDAGARTVEQMGSIRHRFHAAGDDDLGRTGADQIAAEHDCFHARTADLVERGAACGQRQSRANRCLPRRSLAEAGGQHTTHQHFLHVAGRHAGLLQRRTDCGRAKGRRGHTGELAEKRTDRGAFGTDDDDVDS